AVLVGFGFNTKYLQAFLVLPAFAITYLVAAPGRIRRRLGVLVVALVAVGLSSGWWVLAVELIPAAARPYIGGSTNDSALQLLLGYDGLSRIVGGGGGPVGSPGGGFSGAIGILRLLNDQFGGQIGWLIPFALIGLVTGLAIRLRASRLDPARAGYLMWGLWLAVNGIVFSFMSGIIHSYYAVVLAPAIAALVGAGAVDLWAIRGRFRFGGFAFALTIVVSAVWASLLLGRTFGSAPGLGIVILVVAGLVAVIVAVPASAARRQTQLVAAGLGLAVLLAGPASYTIATVATAYSGGDPRSGPATADGGFGGPTRVGGSVGAASYGTASALVTYLLANRGSATWIVATTSTDAAATLELASGAPVMAMGGFSGTDPAPTLAAFKALVVSGQVRYVLVDSRGFGGAFGPGGGSASTAASIDAWAASVGRAVSYGGSGGTLYDLSGVAANTGS
ncbi:MAG: mannosyltransferase YkcB-related protein, partial [Candidatus Limnocylindrales bacterium]